MIYRNSGRSPLQDSVGRRVALPKTLPGQSVLIREPRSEAGERTLSLRLFNFPFQLTRRGVVAELLQPFADCRDVLIQGEVAFRGAGLGPSWLSLSDTPFDFRVDVSVDQNGGADANGGGERDSRSPDEDQPETHQNPRDQLLRAPSVACPGAKRPHWGRRSNRRSRATGY